MNQEDFFFECWDFEANLGLLHLKDPEPGLLIKLDDYWKDWYAESLRNDASLDVADFAEWIRNEFPEVGAQRVFAEPIYSGKPDDDDATSL